MQSRPPALLEPIARSALMDREMAGEHLKTGSANRDGKEKRNMDKTGWRVQEVREGFEGEKAGIWQGDLITSYDGIDLAETDEAFPSIASRYEGRETAIPIEVLRDGELVNLSVSGGKLGVIVRRDSVGEQEEEATTPTDDDVFALHLISGVILVPWLLWTLFWTMFICAGLTDGGKGMPEPLALLLFLTCAALYLGPIICVFTKKTEALGGKLLVAVGVLVFASFNVMFYILHAVDKGRLFSVGDHIGRMGAMNITAFFTTALPPIAAGALIIAAHRMSRKRQESNTIDGTDSTPATTSRT